MDEKQLMDKRSELVNKLNRRMTQLANQDAECSRISGQISIINEWIESFVKRENKSDSGKKKD